MRYLGKGSVSSHLTTLFNVLWYMMIVIGSIVALVTVVGTVLQLTGVVNLDELVSSGHATITFTSPGAEIVLRAPDVGPGFGPLAAVIGVSLVLIPVALLVLNHLRRLMASFAQGNPFRAENVGRIRWIGYLFMIGAVLQSVVELMVGFFLRKVSIPGVQINPKITLDFQVVIAGLVILVLAEIFRLGVDLKEDQDLTV